MAIPFQFGNQTIIIPGSYARTQGATNVKPPIVPFGTVLMIDTGVFASTWGGGSGVNGQLLQGKASINSFTDPITAQSVLMGGLGYQAVKKLFIPKSDDLSVAGAPKVKFLKAATTTCAQYQVNFTNFTFQLLAKNEGICGNGTLDSTSGLLNKGYGWLLKAGVATNSFQLVFYVGTFTGLDAYGQPYNTVASANTTTSIIAQSGDLYGAADVLNYLSTDPTFTQWFSYANFTYIAQTTTTTTTTGGTTTTTTTLNYIAPAVSYPLTSTDLTNYVTLKLFTGGTETYGSSDVNAALTALMDSDFTSMLLDNFGVTPNGLDIGATSTNNLKIQYFLANQARFKCYAYIGGGKDNTQFNTSTGSIGIANFYNNEQQIIIHGDCYENVKVGVTMHYPTVIKAAEVCGLIMGQLPQTPGTFKAIKVDKEAHILSAADKILALKNGVLCTYFDSDFNQSGTILQSINSLGINKNQTFINTPSGSSYEISVENILSYLNKLIAINSKVELLGQKEGPTRSTIDIQTLTTWVQEFLKKNTSTDQTNGLIQTWQNVIVTLSQDAYLISYGVEPNYPVNKLLFTTFALDKSLTPISILNLQPSN